MANLYAEVSANLYVEAIGKDIEVTENRETMTTFFEIKTTKTKKLKTFKLNKEQWKIMRSKKEKYAIYRVINAGTRNAKIIIINNPFDLIQKNLLPVHSIEIEL